MCQVIEELLREEREETTVEVKEAAVKKMLHNNLLSLEQIAEYLTISLDEVKRIQAKQST